MVERTLEPCVGRLAPSPTGPLHLGHARTFLVAWWSVRQRGGQLLLRMEDLDQARCRPTHYDTIRRDLEWLGLDWDGPVIRQSQRLGLYEAALAELDRHGHLYACTCTRKELAELPSAPHGDEAIYPGTCRGRYKNAADAAQQQGRPAALRFRVEPIPSVAVHDRVHGDLAYQPGVDFGDFAIQRPDGVPAYQLACVVDDGAQGITEVVRGDDLLLSAARQQLLHEALAQRSPAWAHVPLVVDREGKRLAKRCDPRSLTDWREAGVDPRRVLAWVARSVGMACEPVVTARDLAAHFRWEELPTTPVATDLRRGFDEEPPHDG